MPHVKTNLDGNPDIALAKFHHHSRSIARLDLIEANVTKATTDLCFVRDLKNEGLPSRLDRNRMRIDGEDVAVEGIIFL